MKLEIDIPSILYNDAKENRGYISVNKMEIAWKAIADGKPIEQEPKKGHWIKEKIDAMSQSFGFAKYHCSNCNHIISGIAIKETNYCPNCGADMGER